MNPRPSREETLFFAAAGMNTLEERAAFLDRECAGAGAPLPIPVKDKSQSKQP